MRASVDESNLLVPRLEIRLVFQMPKVTLPFLILTMTQPEIIWTKIYLVAHSRRHFILHKRKGCFNRVALYQLNQLLSLKAKVQIWISVENLWIWKKTRTSGFSSLIFSMASSICPLYISFLISILVSINSLSIFANRRSNMNKT